MGESESLCAHGHRVNECSLPATKCNYSAEYARARNVPPPAGAYVHPKVLSWMERDLEREDHRSARIGRGE